MSSFETDDQSARPHHRPVRVAKGKHETYSAAVELCEDLGWSLVATDPARPSLKCERRNGFLGGKSTIEVWIEGPEGIPSSITHVRSRSEGALFPRDRSIVRSS
jgi:hypothetical protein